MNNQEDRKLFTAICLHSLLNVLTVEDLHLFKQNPEDWKRFSQSIAKQSIVLADSVVEALETSD